ncbi:MAG: dTDP-4-dehydrorhamnose 3,5-epimerase family protein [Pseudonocardiales bacterium]
MKADQIKVDWLKSIDYQLFPVGRVTIDGVFHRNLTPIVDGRGEVTELWSEPWQGFGPPIHIYQSGTDYGVIKCWHLHEIHTDQFAISRGKVQVTLVDVREDSTSFGHVNIFVLGTLNPGLVRIPPGLLHGWKALSGPETLVLNFQSHVYDPTDEYKFPWDCVLKDVWQPKNG